jgi:hypothetical protein
MSLLIRPLQKDKIALIKASILVREKNLAEAEKVINEAIAALGKSEK